MTSITDFHPAIQSAFCYFSTFASLQDIASREGISKEAVHKRVQKAVDHLKTFGQKSIDPQDFGRLKEENDKQKQLIANLRRELIKKTAIIFLLKATLTKIRNIFPKFGSHRLKALEKKQILNLYETFKQAGGRVKDFCLAIGKSPETILRWQKAFEIHGLNGLIDRTTRPKNFGNKIPSHIKQQLLHLFIRFPKWSEYQIHSYLKYDPVTNYYVSLPTIKKFKQDHQEKSKAEKERIKKRWAFAKGTSVWTVDFTTIEKTQNYKLQLLTVSDARSRFLFDTALFLDTSTESVMAHLKNLFLKYGKPEIIKADNGPEFRVECQNHLKELTVYLFNSPIYYGQFNGAHERTHRSLKQFIDNFSEHKNLTKLVDDVRSFQDQSNHDMPKEYLEGKTSAEIYYSGEDFVPKNYEILSPYQKDGELKIKFTNRNGKPARMTLGKT
jgi:putative transposase